MCWKRGQKLTINRMIYNRSNINKYIFHINNITRSPYNTSHLLLSLQEGAASWVSLPLCVYSHQRRTTSMTDSSMNKTEIEINLQLFLSSLPLPTPLPQNPQRSFHVHSFIHSLRAWWLGDRQMSAAVTSWLMAPGSWFVILRHGKTNKINTFNCGGSTALL